MSAFNWIKIENRCPVCREITTITCQTHVASNYSGDNNGRFHDRTYQLGQKMAWWSPSDYRYYNWCEGNKKVKETISPENICEECSYARCGNCKAELYVIFKFKDITPFEVLEIDKEENWPDVFYK